MSQHVQSKESIRSKDSSLEETRSPEVGPEERPSFVGSGEDVNSVALMVEEEERKESEPSPSLGSAAQVAAAAQREGLKTKQEMTNFKYLGGGANKSAFKAKEGAWVVLATTKGAQFLENERAELAELAKKGIDVPVVGDAVFEVTLDGNKGHAFVEEFVQGVEARPEGNTATTLGDIERFINDVLASLAREPDFETAFGKLQRAIESIEKLDKHFAGGQTIPDFQPMYQETTGAVITIDPGARSELGEESSSAARFRGFTQLMLKTFRHSKNNKTEAKRLINWSRGNLKLEKW